MAGIQMLCHWLQLAYQCLSYGVKSLSPRQCLSASMHMKLDHAVSRLGISTFLYQELIPDTQVSAGFLTSAGLIYFIVNYLTYHNLSFSYVCKLSVVSLRVLLLNWCIPTRLIPNICCHMKHMSQVRINNLS